MLASAVFGLKKARALGSVVGSAVRLAAIGVALQFARSVFLFAATFSRLSAVFLESSGATNALGTFVEEFLMVSSAVFLAAFFIRISVIGEISNKK
ncbi:MAG: hypothetical protein V1820_05745 [archaeon]